MNRRVLGTIAAAAVLAMTVAFTGLFGASSALAASTQQMFLTFYGWYDNTPPGGDISYPQIHDTAGGKGTFADPITFATTTKMLKAGTKVWVPRVKKYFIMEDSCQECGEDWSGHGPNGGPGLRHIDLWLGGKGGNAFDAINCEDALTHYNADNTPTMEPVIVDPPSNEQVDSTPLFNTGTGACYGGAQPNITVGQYKNGSNGQCLDDPGDSSSTGVQLKTAACNSAATSQRFTFEGAFLMIHNLCAAMSGSKVVLAKCNGGPSQQWSVNPNGTISDIQTGQKCVRVSGTNIVPGSCSGSASQWTFTPAGGGSADFGLSLSPTSGTVAAGSATTAMVSTSVVSGSAQSVALSATGAPAGVTVSLSPTSVTAGGSATLTVSASATAAAGPATITVTGTAGSTSHSASFALTVTSGGGGGTTRYEAESGTCDGTIDSDHTGFSGTGFCNTNNAVGAAVQWTTVNATGAGAVTLAIRYSNGTTANRPMDISVNGTVVATASAFTATTNWNTWATKTLTVPVTAGANTVRTVATTANGCPNVDYIEVTQ